MATIEDYKNVYQEDSKLFNFSILHFRDIMCSTKYTIEEKDIAFENLCQDYFRLPLSKNQQQIFISTQTEWEIRKFYEIKKEVLK